jgi:hypothetical protein
MSVQDSVREILARLDLQRQIRAEALLLEALASLPASDDVNWPDDRVGLGPPMTREQSFFEPTDADIQAMLDMEERYEYEVRFHINGRFV